MHVVPMSSGAPLRHQLQQSSLQRTGRHGPAKRFLKLQTRRRSMQARTTRCSDVRNPERIRRLPCREYAHIHKSEKSQRDQDTVQNPLAASDIQPRRHLLQH